MKRKLIILVMSLLVVLTACSNDKKNEETKNENIEETQSGKDTSKETEDNSDKYTEETKDDSQETEKDPKETKENEETQETKKEADLNEDDKMAKEYYEGLKKGEIDLEKTWIPLYLKEATNEKYFKEVIKSDEFIKLLDGEFSQQKMGELPYGIVEIEDKKQIKISDFFDMYKTVAVNEFMNPFINGVKIKEYVKDAEKNKDGNAIGYFKPHYGKKDGIDARATYEFPYLLKKGNKVSIDDPVFGKIEKEVDPKGYFDRDDVFSIDRDIFLLPEDFIEEKVAKDTKELITNFLKAYENGESLEAFFEKGTDKDIFEQVFYGIYGKAEADQFKKPKGFNTRIEEFDLFKYNYHSEGTIFARIQLIAKYDYEMSKGIIADYGGGTNRYIFLLLKYDKKDGKPVFSKLNQENHFNIWKNNKEEALEQL